RFDDDTRRMYLAEYFPGITPQEVQDNTGFEIDLSRAVESRPPQPDVLKVLINKVDPMRIMI
ncbi:MAG: CoA-transferase subunit beta, partial [Pseudoflavonifractor sp.]|nr:CoA-transferase subunit beta [Pseudoflavonifractor sp.]